MLSNNDNFTKENIDMFLKTLAKEYKKINKMPVEIVLVGGASILVRYGFRDTTTDIDVIYNAEASLKEAASRVSDKYGLSYDWFNKDVMQSASYSKKLIECSEYYRTYSNIVKFYTVSGEYLVAMKLRSGREYKHDLSDVVGVLIEHEKIGKPISMKQIDEAIIKMYSSWDVIPDSSVKFINDVFTSKDLSKLYADTKKEEAKSQALVLEFKENYQNVLKQDNVNNILEQLKKNKRRKRENDEPEKVTM